MLQYCTVIHVAYNNFWTSSSPVATASPERERLQSLVAMKTLKCERVKCERKNVYFHFKADLNDESIELDSKKISTLHILYLARLHTLKQIVPRRKES